MIVHFASSLRWRGSVNLLDAPLALVGGPS